MLYLTRTKDKLDQASYIVLRVLANQSIAQNIHEAGRRRSDIVGVSMKGL